MKLKEILNKVSTSFSGDSAKQFTAELYKFNRLISFDAYAAGAAYCAESLKKIGAEDVELLSFPSDGKRMYGNWRSPKSWNVKHAFLELKIAGKWIRFAGYPEIPTSVFTYAAPTNGVIETKLVPITHTDVKGSLCFCDPTHENIEKIIKSGALGVATDFSPNWDKVRGPEDFQTGHRWDNASLFDFQDDSLAGFSLNRKQGKLIRSVLEKGETIPCRFCIHGSLGKGKIYAVTATIKGKTNPTEEAVCVAHLYEAGANDNASGAAAAIESLRSLIILMRSGKIERPDRTIRVVFAFEIVGFMAYFEKVAGKKRKYIAGVNPDMVGEDQKKCRSTLHLYRTPLALATFADALLASFLKQSAGKKINWLTKPYIVNDNVVCDSAIGIPCPALIHLRDLYYHSNEDDMNKVSTDTLHRIGSAMTAFLYASASLSRENAGEIVKLCVSEGIERITTAINSTDSVSPAKKDFLIEREVARICQIEERTGLVFEKEIRTLLSAVNKLNATGKPEVAMQPALAKKAAKIVPVRTVIGPMTLEHLPSAKRSKYRIQPAWAGKWHLVLSWVDGKRNLYDIYRLAAMETVNLKPEDFMEYFAMLKKEKLISYP
ncbi:MAG: M28 family peptidase [Fibrobacteres bacterium]|nr:M28 family peptidase [Fibrobacterota bacterium]